MKKLISNVTTIVTTKPLSAFPLDKDISSRELKVLLHVATDKDTQGNIRDAHEIFDTLKIKDPKFKSKSEYTFKTRLVAFIDTPESDVRTQKVTIRLRTDKTSWDKTEVSSKIRSGDLDDVKGRDVPANTKLKDRENIELKAPAYGEDFVLGEEGELASLFQRVQKIEDVPLPEPIGGQIGLYQTVEAFKDLFDLTGLGLAPETKLVLVGGVIVKETKAKIGKLDFGKDQPEFDVVVNVWDNQKAGADTDRIMELSIEWERSAPLPTDAQWDTIGTIFQAFVNKLEAAGRRNTGPTKTGWVYGDTAED